MKQPLATHAAWFVVSMAAMGLGWMLNKDAGDSAAAMAGGSLPGSKSSRSASTVAGGASGAGSDGAAARTNRTRGKAAGKSTILVLSDTEIEELGAKFRDTANPIERRLAFSRLLEGLTAENAELIRKQIEDLPAQSAEFREFHYAWGAVAGKEAVLFGAATEKADMSPALAGWASTDPQAAIAWIEGLDMENDPRFDSLLKDRKIPSEDLRHHLLEGVVSGLAVADPDLATSFVQELAANGHERIGGMIGSVTEAVLRSHSPGDAAAWAETLPEGRIRGDAMARVAGRYVNEDRQAAASWAAQIAELPEAAGAVAKVGGNWASDNPQEAVEWLNTLPAGDGQNAGMHWALRTWADKDPTAAGEYLQTLPPSGARDSAIGGYSRRVAWEDPQAAMSWAATIGSQGHRLETMVDVGQAWSRKDPAGAAEWVQNAGLSQEVMDAMLNPPRKDRK